ncbi:MAG: hypothetical protein A2506_04400 [Elusimicrobia bacterium RIFOXYD12_FULL_66_9]|nr:MAG: hypothetical protein A2506_04400 [Elusimicrobia bacterium RIFOXYD12_FULL_66_9]
MEAAPGAAICAPRVLAGDSGLIQHDGGRCHILGLLTLDNAWRREEDCPAADGAYAIEACGGTALLVDREALLGRGMLFDESFKYFCEDLDFTVRARACGLGVIHVPRAVVRHGHRGLLEYRYPPLKIFYQNRNRKLIVLKIFELGTILTALPLHCLYECLAAALAAREGQLGLYFRGWASFFSHVPKTLEKRREFFALKRVPDRELLSARALSLHPGTIRAQRRRFFSAIFGYHGAS